ncbi:hypothetical protein H4N54_22650 [Limnospira fusiformis KN01]|uniref:hypothetical protein n=1 Tax=Limnospira fusiformis TaxID=54297 RepID=UPI0016589966|nr:hypothetical protein [Limnospira fusiformis]ULB45174.1 hypothetical protein H4N54_22650 [Limnospira fusiformis KN01]
MTFPIAMRSHLTRKRFWFRDAVRSPHPILPEKEIKKPHFFKKPRLCKQAIAYRVPRAIAIRLARIKRSVIRT